MPSFDIVSEVNQVELRNAVDQANKEITNRFDFKGSDARIEYTDKVLTLYADDEFKLKQVTDVLLAKFAKRAVDVRSLKYGDPEKVSGNKMKQAVTVRTGVEQELAKKIVRLIKDNKLKVQGSIQGDAVRVTGAKQDDLQTRHRARAQDDHGLSAAVRELPRLSRAAPAYRPQALDTPRARRAMGRPPGTYVDQREGPVRRGP